MATKVLIVDDEADFGKIAKINLERNGEYTVFTATNGKDGFDSAKKNRPNVILLDINMPGIDGFKVLEKLKADTDTMTIPVIMLSALTDDHSKLRASELYNESYITKPIEAPDLKLEIEKVLSRTRAK